MHENGAIISQGDRLAEWDPFTLPVITEKPGIVRYQDLVDGKTLTVKPYKLTTDHRLFGKTIMRIGLFNKASERLGTVSSEVITADNASFSFEIPAEHAKPLWDVIVRTRTP